MFWLQSWVFPSLMKPVGEKEGWMGEERYEKIPLNQPGKGWFQLAPTHTGPRYSSED